MMGIFPTPSPIASALDDEVTRHLKRLWGIPNSNSTFTAAASTNSAARIAFKHPAGQDAKFWAEMGSPVDYWLEVRNKFKASFEILINEMGKSQANGERVSTARKRYEQIKDDKSADNPATSLKSTRYSTSTTSSRRIPSPKTRSPPFLSRPS